MLPLTIRRGMLELDLILHKLPNVWSTLSSALQEKITHFLNEEDEILKILIFKKDRHHPKFIYYFDILELIESLNDKRDYLSKL